MEFFIDTGIVDEIKAAAKWGIVDGVTTNPTLIAKSGRTQADVIKEICAIIDGPISAEVIATDTVGMLKEARELTKIHDNVVIKLPLTADGISACHALSSDGIKTNVTLCFSANQALLAAKVGATYISPFIGRLDDLGQDGCQLIEEIRTIYDNYGFTTKILAASIRHPMHVRDVAMIGADVATMPYKAMEQLFHHPLTDRGLEQFLADHAKSQK
ncbi:MAG: fructose-6-phosphate aldolase [Bdellovibrio sp. CG12_big_fil_rev_8_21_14_0_65_39_13]|nr:MAG: fructose-6-phosphate aldolase [Bdellovibrio sp. CG22_combo_CG10-13_8_21_14_all_39_27]PIQ61620.1 MAG: fructose-6-phosphate aldolase [Bdellovibrio sp. CG12_big_fil_rev_8_21_14_0_65_39_13]PIR35683.1 MAG: fructose-6-phosphate aldolase [Bdellovibrio sp. CG11_big_fil_rev_8_21_14_0_20_39_38]